MSNDVRMSSQAECDLRGIFEYVAFQLKSPENAEKLLDQIENRY